MGVEAVAGRGLVVARQQEDTLEALREHYRQETKGEVRMRLHGLWLLRTGRRLREVAATVGVEYRTAQRWVGWYRTGGLAEVRRRKGGGKGNAPYLTSAQEAAV